jgi:TM2 domain-containing membrane protein YozV
VLGIVKHFDPESQSGSITNGKENFDFDLSVWVANAPPEQGDEVVFDLSGVKPFNINLRGALLNKDEAVKSKYIAAILAFLLGWAGVHRFYLGFNRVGIIQILFTVFLVRLAGLPGYAVLWGFVETILILTGHFDRDAKGRPLK